jgi:glycosyltransferase involved in cell wall biosynthesis
VRIVLAHSHANTFGGGERAVLELGRALALNHDVRLLLGGFDPRRTYPELASLPLKRFGRVQWLLARPKADAIITNSFGANLLALRNGSRVAYWVHSTRSVFLTAQAPRPDLVTRRLIDWLAVRRAARLVANSRFTAARIRALYGREADAIIYPGVDLALFQPGVSNGGYAITVGRLSPEKGLDRLFELWRDIPDLPLHVVGTGHPDYVRQLRAQLPSGVILRGQLAASDLAKAYRSATLAVFTPRGEEFGMAPLEAMASGIPVVAWREGGLQETVIDGETGYLADDAVTFRQRVRLLIRDAEQRHAFSAAARRRADQFSWQQTATAMASVCLQLSQTPARAPRA